MKILHIIPSLDKGGAERLVCDICMSLNRKKGVQTLLVSLSKVNEYKNLTASIDYKICDSNVYISILRKSTINICELEKTISQFAPDIIHSHLSEAELVSRQKIRPGIKYVSHIHDNMPLFTNFSCKTPFEKKLLSNFYVKQLMMAKYKTAKNRFLAVSPHTAQYLKKVLPPSLQKNIFELNNAIDFRSFNIADNKRILDKVRLINIGSFQTKKNQILLVRIIEELLDRGIDAHATLLGDGAEKQNLELYVKEKKIEAFFDFAGNVNNVQDYLRQANLYVHTATYEPFGLVLIEAMASGLPIVSLDGKGNAELVKNGDNGYMIKEADPVIFANRIIEIINNEEKYEAMRKNAINFASRYDIDDYTDRLLEIYKCD